MHFAKYHGTGNDFLLVEDLDDESQLSNELIAALCDRHRGVGADGLIRILRGDRADFVMDYYNADGNVSEMCGNGIRCLAKYVFDRRLTSKSEIDVDTRAGLKHLVLDAVDGTVERVTVDMGQPSLERKALQMSGDPGGTFVGQPLLAGGRTFTATAVSMGNPHVVLFLVPQDDIASVDVPSLGREVEHRPEFLNKTNVEFVRVEDGSITMRVWERGSGETMACGTGACAALVASSLAGLTGREADVRFPGGLLRVAWRGDDHVFLSGPAVFVFEGELSAAWTDGVLAGARR